jgi:hypothetical protein
MSFTVIALTLTIAVVAPAALSLVLKPVGADRGSHIAAAIVGVKGLLLATVAALLE